MSSPQSNDLVPWLTRIAAARDRLISCASDSDVLGDKAACKAIFSQTAAHLNQLCDSLRLELQKTYPLSSLIELCKGKLLADARFSSEKHYYNDLFRIPDEIFQYAASVAKDESLSPHAREDILSVFFEKDAADLLLKTSANEYYLCEIIALCQGPPQMEPQGIRVVQHAVRRLRESWQRSKEYSSIMVRPLEQLSDVEKALTLLHGWYLLKPEISIYEKRDVTSSDYKWVQNPILS